MPSLTEGVPHPSWFRHGPTPRCRRGPPWARHGHRAIKISRPPGIPATLARALRRNRPMLAVLLALAAAAGYGGSDYAAGLAARRASVVRVTVLVEVTSAALLMCVVPFISSQAPTLSSALWGIAAGVSG